jgi:endoglucanase
MIRRRLVLGLGTAAGIAAAGAGIVLARARQPAPLSAEWLAYAARFVTEQGRVIDVGNGGISHSEGQGFGMLLAVAYGDAERFARMAAWTARSLAVRDDGLLAWKYDERAADGPVPDSNNASDGDLLVAWALARAGERWRREDYREHAAALARAVRRRVVLRHEGGLPVLLPGRDGFARDGRLTVNLSYWVFPALLELARLDPDPVWGELVRSGRALLERARFGPAALPPDWLDLEPALAPAKGYPARFSYDAVRIPLYLAWAGPAFDPLLAPFRYYWSAPPELWQAEVDLTDPARVSYPAQAGARAVALLVNHREGGPPPAFPALGDAADYYAASLLLLAKLAFKERYAS